MDIYAINKWFILFGVLALFTLFGACGYCLHWANQNVYFLGDGSYRWEFEHEYTPGVDLSIAPTWPPPPTSTPSRIPSTSALSAPILVPDTAAARKYLIEEIPPCIPVPGSLVDPCEPGRGIPGATMDASIFVGDEPRSVQSFVEGGSAFVPHVVLRGTYLPGTVRCAATIFRPPSYYPPDVYGWPREYPIMKCYADVRVDAYVLGSGPTTLTVEVAHHIFPGNWGEAAIAEWKRLWERALIEGGGPDYWLRAVAEGRMNLEGVEGVPTNLYVEPIAGGEAILFIGPAVGTAVETWKVFNTWNIERREDGTVIAVHPYRKYYDIQEHRTELEFELPRFKQAVVAAQEARITANDGRTDPDLGHPKLITNVHDLPKFFREVGAYDHPDGPPVQPPPAR